MDVTTPEVKERKIDSDLDIEHMRSLVTQFSTLGEWRSAQFWADKVVTAVEAGLQPSILQVDHISPDGPNTPGVKTVLGAQSGHGNNCLADDVVALANTMIAQGDYHRALHAVTSRNLHTRSLIALVCGCRAVVEGGEGCWRGGAQQLMQLDPRSPILQHPINHSVPRYRLEAMGDMWRGRWLQAQERRAAAADAFALALRTDPACCHALHALLDNHAYTPSAERALIEEACRPVDGISELAHRLYLAHTHRYEAAPQGEERESGGAVERVAARCEEALVCRARGLIARCEWARALRQLEALDEWALGAERGACLAELRRAPELFALAHRLVAAYPQRAASWYCVAAYYYVVGRSELCRRYLCKARSLCAGGGGAGAIWLLYGHSLARDKEHDQAMAAYFKASQTAPGSHLPKLYIGVECALLSNQAMAERFLATAQSEGSVDPHVWAESGAAAYLRRDYQTAYTLLLRAQQLLEQEEGGAGVGGCYGARWASVADNMGHALRRLGRCAEAARWHARALALRPRHAPSLAARALALALASRPHDALDCAHAALALQPDHAITLTLLDHLVEQLASQPITIANDSEELPAFPFPVVKVPTRAQCTGAAPTTPATGAPGESDLTVHSDMSMSFD